MVVEHETLKKITNHGFMYLDVLISVSLLSFMFCFGVLQYEKSLFDKVALLHATLCIVNDAERLKQTTIYGYQGIVPTRAYHVMTRHQCINVCDIDRKNVQEYRNKIEFINAGNGKVLQFTRYGLVEGGKTHFLVFSHPDGHWKSHVIIAAQTGRIRFAIEKSEDIRKRYEK